MSEKTAEEVADDASSSSTSSSSSPSSTDPYSFRASVLKSFTSLSSVLRFSAIQLLFPFVNGLMLGFGEIIANELGIRWGYIGAEVHPMRTAIRDQVERRRLEKR
ncbi:TOM13-domain-containing protein [Limtongia smithiae]|uniref:TOM13-domain-containing protein n=1 Tax=Limtongia smithiae TaxID=1125753 RepID=UPI0034CE7970